MHPVREEVATANRIQFITNSGSVYLVDLTKRRIRREHGRNSKDSVDKWQTYDYIIGPAKGERCTALRASTADSNGFQIITSKVVSVEEYRWSNLDELTELTQNLGDYKELDD